MWIVLFIIITIGLYVSTPQIDSQIVINAITFTGAFLPALPILGRILGVFSDLSPLF
jgi:hypothetical protein